ncbi:MAG TPA: hypothetical protein DET40_03775 [Lentisphaeria bacterium]|nr:MAG: hypothetical protein A2X45_23615 [Lentisphaerae bacterium GWF2_50_93]HCE42647.1 hypothetical protein [Lentisphaeria bacterium]
MKEISLHILDIVENSVKAGAKTVTLEFSWKGTFFSLRITDDGPGFPDSIKDNPTDPFKTTRKERKVGLGLPLLKDSAEQTGGKLRIGTGEKGGVEIEADFDMGHIDSKPIGDLADLMTTCIAAWPKMNWIVKLGEEGEILNTAAIRSELGEVDMGNRQIRNFISEQLKTDFKPLNDWVEKISPSI